MLPEGSGKMVKQSKKRRTQKARSDRQLIYDRLEEYNHLISIGYSRDNAIKKLRSSPPLNSLEKLKVRYDKAFKTIGTQGISLKGIKLTKDVKQFIKRHHLVKVGDTLYFPGNVKMERPKTHHAIRGGMTSTKVSFHG